MPLRLPTHELDFPKSGDQRWCSSHNTSTQQYLNRKLLLAWLETSRKTLSTFEVRNQYPSWERAKFETRCAKHHLIPVKMETSLLFTVSDQTWPIVYRKEYNVSFYGLEKLHPFDAGKWGHIFSYLKRAGLISIETVIKPNEASKDDLLVVHTKKYLKSLNCSFKVAMIAEVAPIVLVPNCIVQNHYLKPMRFQAGGSVLAGKLSLERGWSINLGGGFHHCSKKSGGGFCAYADITLLIHFLFIHYPLKVRNVMIVDLDAHQGNGYARDFVDNPNVYILDVYNKGIYPRDEEAKRAIRQRVELVAYTKDEVYLRLVSKHLNLALQEFVPDLVVYNAGTDILECDPLGCLCITAEGVIQRDEIVFQIIRARKIPIVMLTSGGYLKKSAKIIASSIMNLHRLQLITGPNDP